MKTQLDLEQDLTLTINPDWQDHSFAITGAAEAILPYAEAVQALDAQLPKQRATRHGNKLIQAATQATDTFIGRVATNIETRVFDARMGTNLYDQLAQKRRDEKIVRQGVKIGLISLTDTVCVKHKHAVDSLKA